MKKTVSLILVISLLLCLCGCSASSQFVGTWHGTTQTGEDCTLTIKSNKAYILQVEDYVALTGQYEKLDDSTILLSYSGMAGNTTITCTLSGGGMHIRGSFSWNSANLRKN